MSTFRDVLEGRAKWSCEEADCLQWGALLPDDCIDLIVTSPPYLMARTYGRDDVARDLESWVAWMVEFVRVFSPKVKGLIAINCEGQTRKFRYLPAPFLLAADLHRAGFNLRKPPVFHRVGIPGSGGPDWLRNDYEPVVCVTRPGRLPWSNNTACGHPPKWAPGGAMSHRTSDGARVNQWGHSIESGARVNQWGHSIESGATVVDEGGVVRSEGKRPSHRPHTKRMPDGEMREQGYNPPALANPGNVLKFNVGGGQMGHELAHENEAPFVIELPAFFVKSFCPPNGITCDPFSGSGTTCHAAVANGRRFIGTDLRQSQVDLCARRMATVTPNLFEAA